MNNRNKDIDNITSGVLIFNRERDQVFLKRRSGDEIFPNTYSLPGGRVKENESIEAAALRELYEETGVVVKGQTYLKAYFYDNMCMFVFTAISDDPRIKMIRLTDIDSLTLAPNIDFAIQDAIDYYQNYSVNLDCNIEALCDDIITQVAHNSVRIEEKTGYDHFLCYPRIGVLGSAIGLLILSKKDEFSELKHDVLKTLLSAQRNDGGWGIRSLDNTESILESTCYSLQAISIFEKSSDAKERAIKWLRNNRLEDYSWGTNKSAPHGKVTSTCLALLTQRIIGEENDLWGSEEWLLQAQNPDGGWGFVKNSGTSNITATSLAILTLCQSNLKENVNLKKALLWLESAVNNSEITEETEISYIGNKRFEFNYATAIYALSALITASGANVIKPRVLLNHISEIVSKRKGNGFWEHKTSPSLFPIWYTYNILSFLYLIMDKCGIHNLSLFKLFYERYRLQLDFQEYLHKQLANSKSSDDHKSVY